MLMYLLTETILLAPASVLAKIVDSVPEKYHSDFFDLEELEGLREKCSRVVEYVEPFSGTVHRFRVYGSWILGEEYRCECGLYSFSVYVFEDWFDVFGEEPPPPESSEWLEYRLPEEFKVSGRVLGA